MASHDRAQMEKYKSDIHIVNKPFYLEGTNGRGILLLHGWSSTPYEMRALGERLHDEGYSVFAPLMTGHGTQAQDLEGVVWQDWRADATHAYEELRKKCDEVFVGGISLGGSLALHLAQKNPDVAGVILMSTPYKLRYEKLGYFATRCVMPFRSYKKKYYPKVLGSGICMTQLISYQRYPIASAYEAFFAIKTILHHLTSVTQPAMIIQSQSDHLVARSSMTALAQALGSATIETRLVKGAYHNFIGDTQHHYIFDDIVAFLKKV